MDVAALADRINQYEPFLGRRREIAQGCASRQGGSSVPKLQSGHENGLGHGHKGRRERRIPPASQIGSVQT